MKKLLATLALGLSLGWGVFGAASVASAQTAAAPAAVTAAVDALRADGTLAALAEQWLSGYAGVPVLE